MWQFKNSWNTISFPCYFNISGCQGSHNFAFLGLYKAFYWYNVACTIAISLIYRGLYILTDIPQSSHEPAPECWRQPHHHTAIWPGSGPASLWQTVEYVASWRPDGKYHKVNQAIKD